MRKEKITQRKQLNNTINKLKNDLINSSASNKSLLEEMEKKLKEKEEEYKNKNPSISKEEKLKNFFNWINDTLKLTKKMDHIILKNL